MFSWFKDYGDLPVGAKVVLDYEDGPKVRQYGTIVNGNKSLGSSCYRVLEDDSGKENDWHCSRTQLTEIVESPLYKVMREI